MRTRGKRPDVPAPDAAWNEIVPGLWMGGHEFRGRSGQREFAVVRGELRLPGHGPDRGVRHHVWPISDGPLDGTQLAGMMRLAQAAGEALDEGRTVLVYMTIGAAGSGTTRIAAAFPRTWRLSLDDCRERVADDFSVESSVLKRSALAAQVRGRWRPATGSWSEG